MRHTPIRHPVAARVQRWALQLAVASIAVALTGCSGTESMDTVFIGPDLFGGSVEVIASTPNAVAVGTERELVRWTSTNNGTEPVVFIHGQAFDGLPVGCTIPGVTAWKHVKDEFDAGAWPAFPSQTVEAGSDGVTSVLSRDIGPECVGLVEIVLVVRGAEPGSFAILQRVKLELRS